MGLSVPVCLFICAWLCVYFYICVHSYVRACIYVHVARAYACSHVCIFLLVNASRIYLFPILICS